MEIWEARELLDQAVGEFLTEGWKNNLRVLIILKQIEELGYDVLTILQASYTIKINPAVKGSIARHRKKIGRVKGDKSE